MENFSVAISFKGSLGWVEFDDEGRTLAEKFLTTPHEIKIPHETLLDFTAEQIDPNLSAENLKIILTRLWEATGVHVDWSRPVEYVKLNPHY